MSVRTFAHVAFRSERGITIQLGDQYFVIDDLDDEDLFWSVRRFASGDLSVGEIANLSRIAPDKIEASFAALRDGGLAYQPQDRPQRLAAADVVSVIQRFGDMWRAHLFRDRMFNPEADSHLVWFGFLVENWHRALALPAIIKRARRAAAGDAAIAEALARFDDEEDDHARFYAQALSAFGVDAEKYLARSLPLLSTRALGWFLNELAERRPLSFLGICRLTESEAGDEAGFAEEAQRIASGYDVPIAAVEPILEHGRLDAGASHKLLIDGVLGSRPFWPTAMIEAVLQDMHDFRHVYCDFLGGVREHYGGLTGSIPNSDFRWTDFPS